MKSKIELEKSKPEEIGTCSIQKYTQPLMEWGYPSLQAAIYVVETNAGFCDKHNLSKEIKYFTS